MSATLVTLLGAAHLESAGSAQPDKAGRRNEQVMHGITCGSEERKDIPDTAEGWANWEVPEYQDKQRFWNAKKKLWGPLACVVAADRLDTVSLESFQHGFLAGMAYVYEAPGINQDYLRMGLVQKGYHCIILRYGKIPNRQAVGTGGVPYLTEATLTTTTATGLPSVGTISGWTASVIPADAKGCTASNNREMKMPGFRAIQTAAGNPRDFPAVTRFMLDKFEHPSIGIRCERGWCALGGNLAALPPMNHKVTGSGAVKARQLVYGWYDDQRLTIAPAATPAAIVPWQRASIVPHPNLDIYKIDVHFKDRWAPVATVILSGKPEGKYKEKWGFTGNGNEDTVYFRHVSPYNETSWLVRVNGTVRRNIKVYWTDHGTAAFLVSTARWAWSDTDDGIWVRCEFGCCEAESS